MSEIVSVNGLLQSMSQYMKIGDSIIFHQAPQAGAVISILTEEQRLDYEGDGSTCVFSWPLSDRSQYKQFMEEVYKHKDNPTVRDQLDKLKIVMELVR